MGTFRPSLFLFYRKNLSSQASAKKSRSINVKISPVKFFRIKTDINFAVCRDYSSCHLFTGAIFVFFRSHHFIFAFFFLFPVFFTAEFASCAEKNSGNEDFLAKIEILEREQAVIQAEMDAEKRRLAENSAEKNSDQESEYNFRTATRDDLEAELAKNKGWAWKKDADRRDTFKITPYGYLALVGAWETNRTIPGEYPLYVQPRIGDDAKSGAYFDMKSSRLGLMISAPELKSHPDVKIGAVFELDFQGAFSLENKPGVLFRKGYIELKNDDFLFLAGQTWDVYSPIFPNMLTYVPGIGCGNLGYRRPMIRYDRYFRTGNGRWEFQGAIAASLTNNLSAYSGERWDGKPADYPEIQYRIAKTFDKFGPWQQKAAFGVSTLLAEKHYQNATSDFHRFSWAVNFDAMIRFTEKTYISAEFFFGELLNSSFGGILQDINPYTLENVCSTGGWVSLSHDFTERLHSAVGLCIDDPWNRRCTGGPVRNWNSCTFANLSFDVTKKFNVGGEYTFWATGYTGLGTAYSHHFQIQLKYSL